MKILFVANANSFLIVNLAKHLKRFYPDFHIDILSESEFCPDWSREVFDNVYFSSRDTKWRKKKIIKFFWLARELDRMLDEIPSDYEVVHILYLSSIYRLLWKRLKKKAPRRVITIFGSEYYRSNSIIKMLQKRMVNEADLITSTNPATEKDFANEFGVPPVKRRMFRFGLSVLDEIDKVTQEAIERFKSHYEISSYDNIIACGYNGRANQNLDKIIDALRTRKEVLLNTVLLFQLPNAQQDSYCQMIIGKLNETGMAYRIFDRHLSDSELAIYRKISDIMIQVQTTDQLSGSMLEHMYAGSKVITGNWLPYQMLDESGMVYFKVNSISELSDAVIKVINDKSDFSVNKAVVRSWCGWDHIAPLWAALYKA